MRLRIFAIFDSKARAFQVPWALPEVGQAVRMFSNAANDGSTGIGANPEDYTLFEIGSFDDEFGTVEGLTHHVNHGLAATYVRPSTLGLLDSLGEKRNEVAKSA